MAISSCSAVGAAIWSRCYGMMAKACACSRSGRSAGASSGRRRSMAWWRSRRRSSATCSKGSTGARRGEPGFLDDGRLCISNNAAERALRGIAVGRHNWTFAGSNQGAERAAAIYTLIETAKLNGVDPRAWLANILARLPDHPAKRIDDLMPWHWHAEDIVAAA